MYIVKMEWPLETYKIVWELSNTRDLMVSVISPFQVIPQQMIIQRIQVQLMQLNQTAFHSVLMNKSCTRRYS